MSERTPTPWTIAPYHRLDKEIIIPEPGVTVDNDDVDPAEAAANAALIVKAVNSHEALVKALKDILDANFDFRNGMPDGWEGDPLQDACNAATKLLDAVLPSAARTSQAPSQVEE